MFKYEIFVYFLWLGMQVKTYEYYYSQGDIWVLTKVDDTIVTPQSHQHFRKLNFAQAIEINKV